MRHAPFFITLPEGNLVNVDQITYVTPNGYVNPNGNGAILHFAVASMDGSFSGGRTPGGAGSSNGSLFGRVVAIVTRLSVPDVLALINNEVALVHAIEQASDHK